LGIAGQMMSLARSPTCIFARIVMAQSKRSTPAAVNRSNTSVKTRNRVRQRATLMIDTGGVGSPWIIIAQPGVASRLRVKRHSRRPPIVHLCRLAGFSRHAHPHISRQWVHRLNPPRHPPAEAEAEAEAHYYSQHVTDHPAGS
jgi:hypothetical protein